MIFTERTVTVRNGDASIDTPVILYRGDRKVEIRFKIMDVKFKFQSGDNIISSTNAASAQLAILNPNGSNAFTGITATDNGTVSFVITGEMIDQLEEVGTYSFHIRLFDEDLESRITLPEVKNGFEVREPITIEDDGIDEIDGIVGESMVGYSIVTEADALNEEGPDTFDSNGDYNKTIWRTGDRITERKLNKIEDAIDTINQSTGLENSIITETSYESQNNITILTDTLYDSLGNSIIAAGWKAGNIKVKPNTQYSIYFESQIYNTMSRGFLCFLDISGFLISYLDWDTATIKTIEERESNYVTFETPAKCEYIGVTLASGESFDFSYDDTNSFLVIEGDVITKEDMVIMVNGIDGYKVFSPKDLLKYRGYLDIPILEVVENNLIAAEETIIHEDALYNNLAELQTEAPGWYSADIPVEGGETYYFYSSTKIYDAYSRGVICMLNEDRDVIGSILGQSTNLYELGNGDKWQVIQTTEDTCYIGITLKGPYSEYNDLIGGVFTDIEPIEGFYGKYVTRINGLPIKTNTNNASSLQGKKWVVVGDSLTEFNSTATKNYHDYVAEDTGVIVVNMGVSGSGYKKSEENNNAFYQRILDIPTDADIITFFGSGNDLSLALGDPNDTGTNTICGCIHQTFKNLFEILPGVKVGVVLPCPWGSYPPSDKTNKMALYSEALKEIASQYSIPVLDLYHGSNLRPWDDTFRDLYYTRDNGDSVHPDENGHAILANKFKMFIQSL